jgi:hypothetical protein
MHRGNLGSLIGAIAGLVYVLVNARVLPTLVGIPVQLLGIAAFGAVLVLLRRDRPSHDVDVPDRWPFDRSFWLMVAAEVVAIATGLVVLDGVFDIPRAGVAWVSVVVGVHFFVLARLLRVPFFRWLGAGIGACGVLGLALAAGGAGATAIAAVSGVAPGALLLAGSWRGAVRGLRAEATLHGERAWTAQQ